MRYAEMGYNLEVDLATGNIERAETDLKLMELHLGGLGTNIKLHWDRVGPEVEPFDDENMFVVSSGFLTAHQLLVPTAPMNVVSPQSRTLAYPMMGGFSRQN